MRTTRITAMLVLGACAPIGQPGHHGGSGEGPDAGTAAATCDAMATKTMDVTFSGSALDGLPSTCWKLNGKLTVMGSVTSLAKLGDLREVADLEITGSGLVSIDTQNPLKVTRSVNIHNTSALVDLGKLAIAADPTCLSYIASVSVVANSALRDLKGLGAVSCVAGPVTVQNNVNLQAINFSGAMRFEGGLTVQDNTRLEVLGLDNLTSITGDLVIRHNVALTSVTMSRLANLHGGLVVDGNDALASLATMPASFPIVEGALQITGNAALTDLGAVAHIPDVFTTIQITNNAALPYCAAHAVGCCVQHAGTAQVSGTGTNNCHSWCFDTQGGCYATN